MEYNEKEIGVCRRMIKKYGEIKDKIDMDK